MCLLQRPHMEMAHKDTVIISINFIIIIITLALIRLRVVLINEIKGACQNASTATVKSRPVIGCCHTSWGDIISDAAGVLTAPRRAETLSRLSSDNQTQTW